MEVHPFDGYCYGPVDLLRVQQGSSQMHLLLRTTTGGIACAEYTDCVYWRLTAGQVGIHMPLVQQLSANELLARQNSDTLLSLRKNARDVSSLLHSWENDGLQFYLHYGSEPDSEYLVVAKNMIYREQT